MADTAPDYGDGPAPKRYPNMRPRPAASLIIADVSDDNPIFLMGQRSEHHIFMPGFYVFPGGRLERSDSQNHAALNAYDRQRLATSSLPNMGAALLNCAMRETLEETGVDARPLQRQMRYIARAITPPGQVRRYDTRFFLLRCDRDLVRATRTPDDELSKVDWVDPSALPQTRIHRITQLVFDAAKLRLLNDTELQKDLQTPIHRFRYGKAVIEHE